MENNGTHNAQDIPQAQHNGDRPGDNVVSFPSNSDTQLRDISTLLQGAPVIQQVAPVGNGSETAASTEGSVVPSDGSAIATSEDFDKVEEKPFARKIGPRVIFGAGLALLILLPLAAVFTGGGSNSNSTQPDEVSAASSEEDGAFVSAEEYAAQQAELEQLRSQQAFIDQQVDAEAIDAAGRQRRQQSTSNPQQAKPSTQTASRSTASTATASRPTRTTATTQPSSVTVRPAPAPSRAAASSSRPAPVTIASRAPAPVNQRPSPQPSAREPEPVDPFERRAQLQALGSYGAPPPGSKAVTAQPASDEASNPFETQYIQTIASKPQAQPAIATSSKEATPIEEAPLTAADLRYEQDAAAVLSPDLSEAEGEQLNEAEAVEAELPVATAPTAIMPGTSIKAELPHGFSWQEGAPLPEVVLSTTEDIMAGDRVAIPAGTQFLGQAQIDPSSSAVSIQIVGMFGEADIPIPRTSVVVQAEDGSVLTANASGGPSRSSGPNMGGFFMESIGNGLGNIISGDDNLAIDIAGGVAETVIDNQVERSEAIAAARASRISSQPTVWTLDARPIRLTFNNYIPLPNAQL